MLELILSSSLIFLLITLLEPSLEKIYLSEKRISCSKNLKQIASSMFSYAEDYDDYITTSHIIGSIASRVIYSNRKWGGRFYNDHTGYLVPYIGDHQDSYTCPGAIYKQGINEFAKVNRFTKKISTYTSFSFVQFGTRKNHEPHIFFANDRNRKEYMKILMKPHPIYMDPLRQLHGWGYKKGGLWDLEGAIIHGNSGDIPILMSDHSAKMYDRSHHEPFWDFSVRETFNIISEIVDD